MTFYQKCLGGELYFQTIGESPLSEKFPEKIKKLILHSELRNEALVLIGTDVTTEQSLVRGNTISLSLNCTSEKEIRQYYKSLSVNGKKNAPLEVTHWGVLFGTLTDKYGNNWLLSYKDFQ